MLASVLTGLITWPQTNIGPNYPPYTFLPNSVAIIDGTQARTQGGSRGSNVWQAVCNKNEISGRSRRKSDVDVCGG